MLALALWSTVILSGPPQNPVAQRLIATAKKLGWQRTTKGSGSTREILHESFALGPHEVMVQAALGKSVHPKPSSSQLVEEPRLNRFRFDVIVPDYSNKRISDMKEYAVGSGMHILGSVGKRWIDVSLFAPKHEGTPKTAKKVYEDCITFADLVRRSFSPSGRQL